MSSGEESEETAKLKVEVRFKGSELINIMFDKENSMVIIRVCQLTTRPQSYLTVGFCLQSP